MTAASATGRVTLAGLLLAVGLNLGLAVPRLGEAPASFDEAATANVVDGDLAGLLDRIRASETNGPVYYYALFAWKSLAGVTPGALRSFSLLAALVAIVMAGWLAASRVGSASGVAVAFLAALSPFLIYYEAEARFYVPSAAWAVVTTLLLLRLQDRPSPGRGVVYGLSAGIGGALFTLAWVLPVAHGIAALLLPVVPARRVAIGKALVWAAGVAGAIAILELPLLREQMAIASDFWIPQKGWKEIRVDLFQLGGSGLPTWILLTSALVGAGAGFLWPRSSAERSLVILCLAWALAVPVALVVLSLLGRPSILARYAAPSVPALWILAGNGLSRPRLLGVVVVLVLFFVGTLPWLDLHHEAIDQRIDLGRTYRAVESRVGPQDAVLYTSRFDFLPARRIHPDSIDCYVFEPEMSPRLRSVLGPGNVVSGPSALASYERVWVVHRQLEGPFGFPEWIPGGEKPRRVPPTGLWLTEFVPRP